jgi:hypothetical protein
VALQQSDGVLQVPPMGEQTHWWFALQLPEQQPSALKQN